eukprot:TRINITY_DN3944_c0_g1_i25.p1 TRINITY_DN3944_c0_g1~~TRINITY_DN3944_c0_g1_i25.p1  ORF type:complete len:639 (-),score=140.57 TRINITY_DN3944_c0_g1_i25:288-2204(-)
MGCTPSKVGVSSAIQRRRQSMSVAIVEDSDFLFREDSHKAHRVPDDELYKIPREGGLEAYDRALIVAPSNEPKLNFGEPDVNYAAHYVYGYNGHFFRNNLFFTADKNIVYPVAAMGVILNPANNNQGFFGSCSIAYADRQHDDDITCLSISKDRRKVASGQAGKKPKLFVWRADTGEYVGRYLLADPNARGVAVCSFSHNAESIALIDFSMERVVHVVDERGNLLWKKPVGMSVVAGIRWRSDNSFAVCGRGKVWFWNTETKEATEGVGLGTEVVTCIDFSSENECYAGSVLGTIYAFKGFSVSEKINEAHKGKINTLAVHNTDLVTGGEDMKVIVRNVNTLAVSYEIRCHTIPRGVDFSDLLVVVGDNRGGITLYKNKLEVAVWLGHHSGEVCGLDANDDIIVTTGEDNKVIVWDYHKCKAVAVGNISTKPGNSVEGEEYSDSQCSRAVCINVKNEEVAIGANNGEVHIRDLCEISKDKKVLACGKQEIGCLRYSPNDNMLAVGTYDNTVYIYTVPEYNLKSKHKHHLSPVISIDWSVNEKYLRSLDENFGMVFWDMVSSNKDKNGLVNTKDIEWDTQSCKAGWSVQGIYPPKAPKSFIRGVDKSRDNELLATGDAWGLVSVYNYPCGKNAKAIKLR